MFKKVVSINHIKRTVNINKPGLGILIEYTELYHWPNFSALTTSVTCWSAISWRIQVIEICLFGLGGQNRRSEVDDRPLYLAG